MIMPLKATESGKISHEMSPGSIIAAGDLLASLQLAVGLIRCCRCRRCFSGLLYSCHGVFLPLVALLFASVACCGCLLRVSTVGGVPVGGLTVASAAYCCGCFC